jgi:hypothetical protein
MTSLHIPMLMPCGRPLITNKQAEALFENYRALRADPDAEVMPVVRLFHPGTPARWLLVSLTPGDPLYGWVLADLGIGYAEQGSIHLSDICGVPGPTGEHVQRDVSWKPTKTISQYHKEWSAEADSADSYVEIAQI